MTEYLDHCESFRTPMSLHLPALHYILRDFCKNPDLTSLDYPEGLVEGDGEALLQLMFDKSPINMRMYGSAKKLAENIKIFKNFPGCHSYFNAALEPYFSTPIIFENLDKNQKFIHKSDFFVMLQSMVVKGLGKSEALLLITIISYFLKSQEKKVSKCDDFVPLSQDVLDKIWKKIERTADDCHCVVSKAHFEKLQMEVLNLSNLNFVRKLQQCVPNTWSQEELERIIILTDAFLQDLTHSFVLERGALRALIICQLKLMIDCLRPIIASLPEMFLPRAKVNRNTLPVTVRVFEDGDQKVLMKEELFNALGIKYVDMEYGSGRHMYETMKLDDVMEEYKMKMKSIQFIRYPIQRTKHAAVPIKGVGSSDPLMFCIPAVDALFEHLKHLLFEEKVFEKYRDLGWNFFPNMFESLETFFIPDYESPYFIKKEATCYLSSMISTTMKNLAPMPMKDIRNAKTDGFTVQNLKNELEYLGLTVTFPDIQNHAETVYAHVDKVKKEKCLRTCDLYDALEYCQLICIFERLPNYKKFLHNQGGCGRVPGMKCELCEAEKKEKEQKKALKLEGSEASAVESNSQITVKTVTFSKNPDFKSSEVLNVTNPMMAASDTHLTELNTKIASLEAQLASQSEKSSQLESDLLKATQKNELLHLEHIKLQSENEVNKGVMCQLIDKLSINQESPRSIPIVTSSTSLIECIICHIDIFNTQNIIKCPNCKIRFHKKCALNYSKDHKECPSCKETIQESAICLN